MSDCIFCKIVEKEIPNHTVYENENVLAFLDIFPHAKGHTVVIPKKHYNSLSDLPEREWEYLAIGLKRAMEKIKRIFKPTAINIAINDGTDAGQVVPHVHWHIMPRYVNDGGGSSHSIVKNPGDMKVEDVAKLLVD